MQSRAAVLSEYRKFEIRTTTVPEPGPGEVTVRVKYASICGTDMHIFSGDFHPRTPVPFIPGHELGGVIEKVGDPAGEPAAGKARAQEGEPAAGKARAQEGEAAAGKAGAQEGEADAGKAGAQEGEADAGKAGAQEGKGGLELRVGDKVAIDPIIWCGSCAACKAGHFPACTSLKLIGIDLDGGFTEFLNVPAKMIHVADPGVPDMHIALTEIYSIGFHACRRAGAGKGDSLAIFGAGRVGNVILQAARTLTDGRIFLVDVLEERLELAQKHYRNVRTINALKEDPAEVIRSETASRGVDIAFEAVGHPRFPEETVHPARGCIQAIKGGGRVCVLGLADDPAPIVFKELIWKEGTIIASRVSHGEYPKVLEMLKLKKLQPGVLVSEMMPLDRIQEAFELLEQSPEKYLKVLIRVADTGNSKQEAESPGSMPENDQK